MDNKPSFFNPLSNFLFFFSICVTLSLIWPAFSFLYLRNYIIGHIKSIIVSGSRSTCRSGAAIVLEVVMLVSGTGRALDYMELS